MSDSVKKILLEKLRKILLPDFTNKLTWLFGFAGVSLIAGPAVFRLIGKISSEISGVPIEIEFFSEDRSGYGVFLCLLALSQNIVYNLKSVFSEASVIRDHDRIHEMNVLDVKHSHERLMKELDSQKKTEELKRAHDIKVINEIISIFPFEESCGALMRAPDFGIDDFFQEGLAQLANRSHVSYNLYTEHAEQARIGLVTQAIKTHAVLSSHLIDDPRRPGYCVPFYEQKSNGLQDLYYENQEKMRKSCDDLFHAYQNFVCILQQETLWGITSL